MTWVHSCFIKASAKEVCVNSLWTIGLPGPVATKNKKK